MEKKRSRRAEESCLDNLIPLLENEFNRHQILKSERDKQNRGRLTDKSVKNLSVTKSVNENSLDLVINVELRKHKSNYMDAYFTDLDLKERKLFHETVSKREHLSNKSKLSELSLLFPDDLSISSSNSNSFSNSSYEDEDKECCKNNTSSKVLLTERKENPNRDGQDDRDLEKLFFEPSKKLLKNWSPVHYGDILNMNMNEDYEEEEEEVKEDDDEDKRLTKDTTKNHTNFQVMPLMLNKCNKNFFSINNLVSVTNHLNYITKRCAHDDEASNLGNEIVAVSDPEAEFKKENLQYRQSEWQKICSTVQFSDSPCSIKMRTSSKFSAYENCNYQKCKTDASSQSKTHQRCSYKKKNFKFNQDDSLKGSIVVKQSCESGITNSICTTDVTKVTHNKDINYIKRKYHREYKGTRFKQKVENKELLDIFNTDNNTLLDFDLDIDMLKRPSNVSVSIECKASIKKEDVGIESENNNNGLLEDQDTDNVTATKKILEVIFPVKSLRICRDNINNNDLALKEDPSLTNVSPVKSDNCNLAKYEQLQDLSICQSSLLNRGDDCDDNSRSLKHHNLRTMLNSEEFRSIVMNIIEQYLKDNYLRDDNFEVIVVPKDRNTCKKNMIDALKGIINKDLSEVDLKPESNYGIALPDLSTFNPRDYKGHTRKYGRNNQIVVMPEIKTLQKKPLSSKSSKHNTSLTVNLPLGEIGLFDPNTKEACKNLTKYLSMPVMKFKSSEDIMDIPNSNVEHQYYVQHLNCYNTELILDVVDNESKAIQPYVPQLAQENVLLNNIDYEKPNKKLMKMRKKNKKFDKCDFLAKFNEFKEVFDKVENKHNTLLDTLSYDPCGLLFKSKSGQFMVIKRS